MKITAENSAAAKENLDELFWKSLASIKSSLPENHPKKSSKEIKLDGTLTDTLTHR